MTTANHRVDDDDRMACVVDHFACVRDGLNERVAIAGRHLAVRESVLDLPARLHGQVAWHGNVLLIKRKTVRESRSGGRRYHRLAMEETLGQDVVNLLCRHGRLDDEGLGTGHLGEDVERGVVVAHGVVEECLALVRLQGQTDGWVEPNKQYIVNRYQRSAARPQ